MQQDKHLIYLPNLARPEIVINLNLRRGGATFVVFSGLSLKVNNFKVIGVPKITLFS